MPAKAGELVVKEWEQTGQSSAIVIWDGRASTSWGAGEFDSTEWGLSLCASLCHALLGRGIPCDFARLDASPKLIEARAAGNLKRTWVEARALDWAHLPTRPFIDAATEVKTVWIPYGEG